MARNGKADDETPQALDLEHELPPAGDSAELPQADAEAQKLQQERDALLDRLARLQAEFDNYRKRSAREQQEYRDYALTEAIRSLLPIVDSFDRALATEQRGEDFHNGIELINRQFHDTLGKLGVQPVEAPRGEVFDPNLHEAVQMVDTDEVKDHHVLDQLQRGYRIKDRLLRPAMVRVATNSKKN